MTRRPRIAVVYTHFPHYRAPVYDALSRSGAYAYTFYYDPAGIKKTITSGATADNHRPIAVRMWRGLMWQGGAIRLARDPSNDGFVFLGNPFILSTWIAAWVARRRGKPVFFWTHGWLRRESGVKGWLRRRFYRLADALMVYGARARVIGEAEGFDPARLHVIGNSLDYDMQRQARETVLADPAGARQGLPDKPYFLTVSRLVDSVALDQAIDAMAKLDRDAALVVVGAGPKRDALDAQAQALGVDVHFLGAVYDEEHLARLFLGAQAVVSPGKVGLLAMHALAYGATVITHDNLDRQMPEVEAIEPGVTGAFFRYGDKDDLAREMTLSLDRTEEDHLRCRAAGIARLEEGYTPEAQVAYITAALDSVIKRGV
jgi:glycosyltransferase involved in cell wall biosynthesis